MPGMTAYVTIPIGEVKDVNKIDIVALRFSPNERILNIMGIQKPEKIRDKVVLYKLEGKNKVVPVYVSTGLSNLSEIEIKSSEIKEGDKIWH